MNQWIKQFLVVFVAISVLLFGIELSKGHQLVDSLIFAFLWSFISSTVYVTPKYYFYRKIKRNEK